MHSKYTNLFNVACDIFSIIPHGVGMEASVSFGRDVIGWRQSKTSVETLRKEVLVRQFAPANNGILPGADPELDTTNTENHSEMKKEVEERKLHRLSKCSQHFGDVAGQPKPTCYPEGTSRSKPAADRRGIHFGHRRDRRCIVVTLST